MSCTGDEDRRPFFVDNLERLADEYLILCLISLSKPGTEWDLCGSMCKIA